MAKKLAVRKYNGSLHPATQHDHEIFETLKLNQPYHVEIKQWSQRSLQHHKLYWSGLVGLIAHYWTPTGGLISKAEKDILKGVSRFVEAQWGDSGPVNEVFKAYLEDLKQKRSETISLGEPDKQAIHDFIKEEAGYFKWVQGPGGLRKELLSINFNALSQEEFNVFFKRAFNVAWNFILSRHFESKEQMKNAVDQLQSMG